MNDESPYTQFFSSRMRFFSYTFSDAYQKIDHPSHIQSSQEAVHRGRAHIYCSVKNSSSGSPPEIQPALLQLHRQNTEDIQATLFCPLAFFCLSGSLLLYLLYNIKVKYEAASGAAGGSFHFLSPGCTG